MATAHLLVSSAANSVPITSLEITGGNFFMAGIGGYDASDSGAIGSAAFGVIAKLEFALIGFVKCKISQKYKLKP